MSRHLLLINPHIGYVYRSGSWRHKAGAGMRGSMAFGLVLPYLAALAQRACPKTIIHLLDENVERIRWSEIERRCPPSETLVGLTAQTLQIVRAYELADQFRAKGYPVMLGGIHASLTDPAEAGAHCDALIVGEAEETLPQALADFEDGRLQAVYRAARPPSLENLPRPLFERMAWSKYASPSLAVQTARGCVYNCDFCSVRVFNATPRFRPIGDVIGEIKGHLEHDSIRRGIGTARRKRVELFFVDDNFCMDPDRAMELCRALLRLQQEIGLPFRWTAQLPPHIAENQPLVALMAEAGCRWAFVGVESLSRDRLAAVRKTQNHPERYAEQFKAFKAAGINVFAAWIVGFEGETSRERADALRFFCEEAQVDLLAVNPLTPFVGTRFYERMLAENKVREERYWLSPDANTRMLPLNYLDVGSFTDEYWRLNQGYYSLRNLARICWRNRKRLAWNEYAKFFLMFHLNARYMKCVMSS